MCLDETQGHTFSLQLALQRKRDVPTFHARWNGKSLANKSQPPQTIFFEEKICMANKPPLRRQKARKYACGIRIGRFVS